MYGEVITRIARSRSGKRASWRGKGPRASSSPDEPRMGLYRLPFSFHHPGERVDQSELCFDARSHSIDCGGGRGLPLARIGRRPDDSNERLGKRVDSVWNCPLDRLPDFRDRIQKQRSQTKAYQKETQWSASWAGRLLQISQPVPASCQNSFSSINRSSKHSQGVR
jgi:hypothetical protein